MSLLMQDQPPTLFASQSIVHTITAGYQLAAGIRFDLAEIKFEELRSLHPEWGRTCRIKSLDFLDQHGPTGGHNGQFLLDHAEREQQRIDIVKRLLGQMEVTNTQYGGQSYEIEVLAMHVRGGILHHRVPIMLALMAAGFHRLNGSRAKLQPNHELWGKGFDATLRHV